MSHLVKPTAFRAGKTYLWQNNVLFAKDNSGSLFAPGLSSLTSRLFNRKRLYLVNSSLTGTRHGKVALNLLYAPRIKTKPRNPYSIGGFAKRVLYRPFDWPENLDEKVKKISEDDEEPPTQLQLATEYVVRKQDKIAKLPKRRRFQINKWLTRRMFRGAGRLAWLKRKTRFKNFKKFSGKLKRPNRAKRSTVKKLHRMYYKKIHYYRKWKFDKHKTRRFNNKKFSIQLSRTLHREIKVKAINIFSYFAAKGLIQFKTQQRHLWNFRYRRWRFKYKNYFDVVNGFFIISLIDRSENFLINVLKATLPQVLRIRKFFHFLNSVIKGMPEIKNKYSVFKMMLAGKIAGGTKRTKSHTIGYGILPVQTLALRADSNFLSYAHVYGEFGLKLLMCKDPKPVWARGRWR